MLKVNSYYLFGSLFVNFQCLISTPAVAEVSFNCLSTKGIFWCKFNPWSVTQ